MTAIVKELYLLGDQQIEVVFGPTEFSWSSQCVCGTRAPVDTNTLLSSPQRSLVLPQPDCCFAGILRELRFVPNFELRVSYFGRLNGRAVG